MRSSSLRLARLAGENTTISTPSERARQAQKMAIENVFPKRRGVDMSTSELHLVQPSAFMICGLSVAQLSL